MSEGQQVKNGKAFEYALALSYYEHLSQLGLAVCMEENDAFHTNKSFYEEQPAEEQIRFREAASKTIETMIKLEPGLTAQRNEKDVLRVLMINDIDGEGGDGAAEEVVVCGGNAAGSQAEGSQLLGGGGAAVEGIEAVQLRRDGAAFFIIVIGGRADLLNTAVDAPVGDGLHKAGENLHTGSVEYFFSVRRGQALPDFLNQPLGKPQIGGGDGTETIVDSAVLNQHILFALLSDTPGRGTAFFPKSIPYFPRIVNHMGTFVRRRKKNPPESRGMMR